jgi:hypothetical protein
MDGFANSTGGGEMQVAGIGPAPVTFSTNYANIVSGALGTSAMAGSSDVDGNAHTSADTECAYRS